MKGVVWKYLANPDDQELRDEMGKSGCRVLNPDPDFWGNKFPVWSICGPRVRATLDEGDVLFFTPTLSRSRRAQVPDYLCTGYLVVNEILPDSDSLLSDPRFTDRYKDNYRKDLNKHLKGDPATTRAQRPKRIVLGDRRQSVWFGRRGHPLEVAAKEAGLRKFQIRSRRVRTLDEDESKRLRAAVS